MPEEHKHSLRAKRSWRSVLWFLVGFVMGPIVVNAGFILSGYLLSPPVQNIDVAKHSVQRRLYDYLTHEGHEKRGPRFRALVGTLDNMRWENAGLSRHTVKAYLGPPDHTRDEGSAVHLGYHYKDDKDQERMAIVTFRDNLFVRIGYGLPTSPSGNGKGEGL